MIDAGVTVALGSDSPSTHNCDIFLDMKAAIDQQRIHFKNANILPPGKVLEMATIDGCKVLGLDKELGSVEAGKKADLITVDLFQPHLYPIDMLIYRLVYNATGRDVVDVAVSGRLVMEDRKILTIDEARVLQRVQAVYERFVKRAGLAPLTKNSERFWGVSRSE